jgi:protein-tyrosine phosphatase
LPSRTLDFEGCVNFRDLGGYRTVDGRQIGWRRLFRADGLNKLTSSLGTSTALIRAALFLMDAQSAR